MRYDGALQTIGDEFSLRIENSNIIVADFRRYKLKGRFRIQLPRLKIKNPEIEGDRNPPQEDELTKENERNQRQ